MNSGLPSIRKRSRGWLLIFIVPFGGCAEAAPERGLTPLPEQAGDPGTLQRFDSLGVDVLVSTGPHWTDEPALAWRVAPSPTLVLQGPNGAEGPEVFALVSDVETLSDGRVVVADRRTATAYFFTGTGDPAGRFGGQGEGPGELRGLIDILRCDTDTMFVAYRGDMNVFAPDGSFVRRVRVSDRHAGVQVSGVAPRCDAYVARGFPEAPDAGEVGFGRVQLFWTEPSLETLTPLAEKVVIAELGTSRVGGEELQRPLPWTGVWGGQVGFHPDGLVTGYGARPELRLFDRSGALASVIRWTASAAPVTSVDRERYASLRAQFLQEAGASARSQAVVPALRSLSKVPDVKPVFDGLMVADDGSIWLRAFPEDATGALDGLVDAPLEGSESWTVLGMNGAWLGSIEMPVGFALRSVRESDVWGIHTDVLGVQTVRRHRILRPAG